MLNNLSKNVFFLGIGGIGMSALAKFVANRGHVVRGYDKVPTFITTDLIKNGIDITFDTSGKICFDSSDSDWTLIYTPAIKQDNPYFQQAIDENRLILKRSELLGTITENYFLIAVAGTHGKTTVTAMVTHLLKENDFDPSAFIGGVVKNFESNLVEGNSNLMVVEADEYDRSFLQLKPDILIVTALDPDHLDIYESKEKMVEAYEQLVYKIKPGGKLILAQNVNFNLTKRPDICVYSYGEKNCMFSFDVNMSNENISYFSLKSNDYSPFSIDLENLELHMLGLHNVSNMTAAIITAKIVGAPDSFIRKSVSKFAGISRRFDLIIHTPDLVLIDDYAHHPSEIRAAIDSARLHFPQNMLIVAFQPHLFSRTRDFATDFAHSLNSCDKLFITHIYPAREQPIEGISCEIIYEKVDNTIEKYIVSLDQLSEVLFSSIVPKTSILILGAGDISTVIPELKDRILGA